MKTNNHKDKPKLENNSKDKNRADIDALCKIALGAINNSTKKFLNFLFDDKFGDEFIIEMLDKEHFEPSYSANRAFDKRISDYFVAIKANEYSGVGDQPRHVRIEMQTYNDPKILRRCLEYDIDKSLDMKGKDKDTKYLRMPYSAVIYPIQTNIPKVPKTKLCGILPDGKQVLFYETKILKVWDYDDEWIEKHDLKLMYWFKWFDKLHKVVHKKIEDEEYQQSFKKYADLILKEAKTPEEEEKVMNALEAASYYVKEKMEYEKQQQFLKEIQERARKNTREMMAQIEREVKEQVREEMEAEARAKGWAEGIKKGRAEGRAKGRAEGRAEGIKKGRAEGANDKEREIAMRLLNEGFDDNSIVRLVKINPAELAKIKASM